jgi:hypothetical protein
MNPLLKQVRDECPGLFADLGLRLVDARYDDEVFGNAYVTLEGNDLRVRVVKDRGLVSVEVSPTADTRWWPLDMVSELIGATLPGSDRVVGRYCAFLLDNYTSVALMFSVDRLAETNVRLDDLADRRAAAMLRASRTE